MKNRIILTWPYYMHTSIQMEHQTDLCYEVVSLFKDNSQSILVVNNLL